MHLQLVRKIMAKRPRATKNKAKDVETPKIKRIDIPDAAKADITAMSKNLDTYISGVVAGLGIKGRWAFDFSRMQIVIQKEKPKG